MTETKDVEMKIQSTFQTYDSTSSETDESSAGDEKTQTSQEERVFAFVRWTEMTRSDKYGLIGWILFVTCAVLYLEAAIEWASLTSIIGSLVFLLACLVFMVPMLWIEKQPPLKTGQSPLPYPDV